MYDISHKIIILRFQKATAKTKKSELHYIEKMQSH